MTRTATRIFLKPTKDISGLLAFLFTHARDDCNLYRIDKNSDGEIVADVSGKSADRFFKLFSSYGDARIVEGIKRCDVYKDICIAIEQMIIQSEPIVSPSEINAYLRGISGVVKILQFWGVFIKETDFPAINKAMDAFIQECYKNAAPNLFTL